MPGNYSIEEATQWMQENEAIYTDPKSTLKCVGVHIDAIDRTCHVFCLDYRRGVPSKNIQNEWHYKVDCFSNHYLLPLNPVKWIYKETDNNKPIQEEFLYTPELAKEMSFSFIELKDIQGVIGRKLALMVHPRLVELDQKHPVEKIFFRNAVSFLNEMNFHYDDNPF